MAKKKKKSGGLASAFRTISKAIQKTVKKTQPTVKKSPSSKSVRSLVNQGTSSVRNAVKKTRSVVKPKKTNNKPKKNVKPKVTVPTIKQTPKQIQQKRTQFKQFKKDSVAGRFGKTQAKNQKPNQNKVKTKPKQTTYKTGNNTVASLLKGVTSVNTVAEIEKAYSKGIKEAEKNGMTLSDDDKNSYRKQLRVTAKEEAEKAFKEIDKRYKERIETAEQLSKTEREAYHRARIFSSTRGHKVKGSTQTSEKEFLENNKEIAKKLAKLQAADYVNHSGLVGVLEGAAPTSIANKNVSKYYSDRDAAAVDRAKDTTAYKAGYTAGTIGSFFIGGGGGAAEKGIQTALKKSMKIGAKKAAKSTGKTITKKELKNIVMDNLEGSVKVAVEKELKAKGKSEILDKIVDNTWRSLKLTGKDKAKSFVASRAADAIISTPFNVADAVKQGTDARGNFNPVEAAKTFAASTVMDMTVGGVVDGASILSKGGNYKKLTNIIARRNMGEALTEKEVKWYNDMMEKVRTENATKRQANAVKKASADYDGTGINVNRMADGNIATVSAKSNYNVATAADTSKAARSKRFGASNEAVEAYRKADPVDIGTDGNVSSYVKAENVPVSLKATYSEYVSSVDPTIKKAVQNLREGRTAGAKSFHVASVTSKEVDIIKKELGLDVSGYKHTIEADRLLHIEKKHGIAGKTNKTMVNVNDIARMGWVIENADSIEISKNPSKASNYRNASGEIAPVAIFRKRINGDVVVIEAVPDAGTKELRIATMYFDTIKKGDSEVPDVKTPSLTSENDAQLTPSKSSIDVTSEDVNIEVMVNDLRARGVDDDGILETLSKEGINPIEVRKAIDGGIDEDFVAEARRVGNNPESTTQFDTIAEKIKYDNVSPRERLERATERISPEEVPHARQTAVKLANQVDDDVAEIIEPWVREGMFDKATKQAQEAALKQAKKEIEDGTAYQRFLEMDFDGDEHLFMARAQVLFDKLSKAAVNDDDAAKALLEVIDKATDASSHAGRLLNATKMLLRTTPEGRLRIASKEALKLQEKYADRLKGKAITLSDEQIQRILKAETDEEIEDVMGQISIELWDDIPATWFEKWNEIRHFSMLANPKTHIRNVVGNSVFKVGRSLSDAMEIGIYKIPAVRNRIKNLGGSVEMVHVSMDELHSNKAYLNDLFDKNYKKSNSKQKYIETTRPDGSPIVRTKWLNKLIQKNYDALEWEDVALTLRREYKKNYLRWAKSKDIPLDKLDDMTPKQKTAADAFALKQAEIATFRDNSKMADVLVRFKEKTAGEAGKGKLFYRAANMVLESQLPFVKTPVNILRRSIDYSPISLVRAMNNLRKISDVEALKTGIHQLSTGLTGTGVFALGATLAANDFITVEVGDVSGDEYYDRDMGYQDFSIKFHWGDKEYSATIDWLSPMQTSLFMGANCYDMLKKDGLTTRDIFDGMLNVLDPMMDMSFMSSAKDTMDMFMETAFRGDEANYSDAIMNTLFGSIPQNYLNSFVPQIFSQTAGMLDDKMRDTRSTKEDPLARSWESWERKMINRIPVLREKILNPKIDRFGNDIETGSNPVIKFLNAYLNPSNVKQIHLTKMDKEIIDIYNNLPEGKEKKHYYYNFTGNPSYELANGKRMSYKDLYEYGKRSRQDQAGSIDKMIKSNSYKNMTYNMKAKEVSSAHWNAEMVADNKTYGSKYLLNKIKKNEYSSDSDKDAIKLARSTGTVSDKDMANYIIKKEKFLARCHETDYYTKAMAVALYGNDNIMKVFQINSDKVDVARDYVAKYGEKAYKMFSNASCNVMSGIDKADVPVSTNNKAISAADFKINEDTYKAMGISADKANMGVGLKKFGYSYESLAAMEMNAKYDFDSDGSGTLKKSEIIDYIDSLGLDSNDEKAVLFAYFSNANNPYGSVPNYLGFKGVESGGGGSGRSYSGYGRSKKGKSSSTKTKASKVPSWDEWVKDYITTDVDLKRVKFEDWDSPIDSAYIKKIQGILKNKPKSKSS